MQLLSEPWTNGLIWRTIDTHCTCTFHHKYISSLTLLQEGRDLNMHPIRSIFRIRISQIEFQANAHKIYIKHNNHKRYFIWCWAYVCVYTYLVLDQFMYAFIWKHTCFVMLLPQKTCSRESSCERVGDIYIYIYIYIYIHVTTLRWLYLYVNLCGKSVIQIWLIVAWPWLIYSLFPWHCHNIDALNSYLLAVIEPWASVWEPCCLYFWNGLQY